MKMNNAETDKIDLEEITDNLKYARMAMLVDKEEFIISIKKTRKLLGLKKLLDYDKVAEWLHRGYKNSSIQHMDKVDKEIFDQSFCLSQSVADLKEKFHKNVNYTNAIKYAILAGKITDKEISATAFCEEYPFSKKFEEAELSAERPMVAIFVSPETKIDELKLLFNSSVKEKFKEINKNVKLISRGSPTFEDARNWYWKKKSMTFDKLYKDYAGGNSYEAMKRSVERYSKRLQSDI